MKINKIAIFAVLFILTFLLFGCAEQGFVLPDLTGKSTDEVRAYFEKSKLEKWNIIVKDGLVYGDQEGEYEFEKFYGYAGQANIPGAKFDTSKKLNIYVTAYNLTNSIEEFIEKYSNSENRLRETYANITLEGKTFDTKSFLTDGIGVCTVVNFVDGDTTRFKDRNGTLFSLRYLGVDTPESTAAFEPWGKAAAKYTEDSLTNAKKIVLESDEPGQADTNGRSLGWVWYQDTNDKWHLLNLELILFCYSKDKADSSTDYGDFATSVGTIVGNTHRRVWGEKDPDFDYSTDPKEISIQELRTNFASYYSKKVKITGVIALVDNNAPVIVDPETGYGIYFYIPDWTLQGVSDIVKGNEITIVGVCTYYGIKDEDLDSMDEDLGKGSPQLSSYDKETLVVHSTNNTVEPVVLEVANLKNYNIGMYCQFNNLEIKSATESSTGSGFTVVCQDNQTHKTLSIRVDDSHYHNIEGDNGLSLTDFKAGTYISSVVGYLSYYGGYQLTLISIQDVNFQN